jgi:predicted esterase
MSRRGAGRLRRATIGAALACAGVAAIVTATPRSAAQQGKPAKEKKSDAGFADFPIDDDVKDVPCKDLHVGSEEKQRYFLFSPKEKKAPAAGYALLIVMPGGTGEASFNNFVRRIWQETIPEDWVVAQLVCVKWKPDQTVIWPTRFDRAAGQKFTTEEYFAAVVDDVQKVQKLKIDPARIYQMGWSSGGPAEYAIALQEKHLVTGSYVAMSVFHDELLPDIKHAKGQAFFLDHSPDDERCKFEFATKAKEELTKAGATVELVTYQGGHGWNDDPYARMKKGFAWLEKSHGKPVR